MEIKRKITKVNYKPLTNKRNMWIIIHYVGAVSTAKNNVDYFYENKHNASATYFVDENEIWQCVEDKDAAWHIGALIYKNSARNENSIGIEMCCKKDAKGKLYIENKTIENTIWLTKMLMKKYDIPVERVVRHYDCTGKICPEPFVSDLTKWNNFLEKVKKEDSMADIPEVTIIDKEAKIKEIMNIDSNTIFWMECYKWGVPYLIDKMYATCVDAEKWRNQAKNDL